MPRYDASGFRDLSISGDGMEVSFTFAQAGGEDVVIAMPAAALSVVLPYLAEAEREASRRREADPPPEAPPAG